ncbi:MAG: hypothetical protein KatS3mg082_2098 [Nitrospiraceae bacterium]|nr:MAG: hypothetical protein KatS3mg082_2098 [Nitrospiraceae bacterium]
MACATGEISDEGIDSAKTSQALREFLWREHQLRETRVSIWWIGIEMAMIFLVLVLLLFQVIFSGPRNAHPPESAWYRHAAPLFKILGRDRPGSVLAPVGDFSVTFLPFTNP